MNWSKAKTILIAALIITDLILILTYGNFSFKDEEFKDHEALAEFLAQKSIYVEAGVIPALHKDMPVLYVQKEGLSCGGRHEIYLKNNQPVVVCVFEDGSVKEDACEWLKPVSFHNKKQKTISAAQGLLLFLAQNPEKKDVYIDKIEMVYWLDESGLDDEAAVSVDTALPVWKIVYNGGEVSYIDAYEHQ